MTFTTTTTSTVDVVTPDSDSSDETLQTTNTLPQEQKIVSLTKQMSIGNGLTFVSVVPQPSPTAISRNPSGVLFPTSPLSPTATGTDLFESVQQLSPAHSNKSLEARIAALEATKEASEKRITVLEKEKKISDEKLTQAEERLAEVEEVVQEFKNLQTTVLKLQQKSFHPTTSLLDLRRNRSTPNVSVETKITSDDSTSASNQLQEEKKEKEKITPETGYVLVSITRDKYRSIFMTSQPKAKKMELFHESGRPKIYPDTMTKNYEEICRWKQAAETISDTIYGVSEYTSYTSRDKSGDSRLVHFRDFGAKYQIKNWMPFTDREKLRKYLKKCDQIETDYIRPIQTKQDELNAAVDQTCFPFFSHTNRKLVKSKFLAELLRRIRNLEQEKGTHIIGQTDLNHIITRDEIKEIVNTLVEDCIEDKKNGQKKYWDWDIVKAGRNSETLQLLKNLGYEETVDLKLSPATTSSHNVKGTRRGF